MFETFLGKHLIWQFHQDSIWARMTKMLYWNKICHDDRNKIQEFTSETKFKFGDGEVVASEKSVVVPFNIAGKDESLKTDVAKSEIPVT